MTYKEIVKMRRAPEEQISVEVRPSDKLALSSVLRKPSFVISSLRGIRTIMLQFGSQGHRKALRFQEWGKVTYINIPLGDMQVVAEAYRIGLAATTLS